MIKAQLLLTFVLSVSSIRISTNVNKIDGDVDFTKVTFRLFKTFCTSNHKNYNNKDEYNYRYNVFNKNLQTITRCSCGKKLQQRVKVKEENGRTIILIGKVDDGANFTMDLNNFADLTDEEFEMYYLLPANFVDTKIYSPVSKIQEPYEGGVKLVELADDIDPVDEVLKLEQGKGFTSFDPIHFIKNLDIFHKKRELKEMIIADIKVSLERSLKRANEESHGDTSSFLTSHVNGKQTKHLPNLSFSLFNERRLQRGSGKVPKPAKHPGDGGHKTRIGGVEVPTSLNWNRISGVGRVKAQGKCNSCYAFAGTGAVEAHSRLINGKSVSLSEQEILDCSTRNRGCTGGLPYLVMDYIISKGISTTSQYGYTAVPSTCRARRDKKSKYSDVKGYIFAKKGVANLVKALQYGPVSILMHASKYLKFYHGGIYEGQGCDGYKRVNHAAVVYGYSLSGYKPYFMLKNGWGSSWGESGHYKVGIGALTSGNTGYCSIARTRYNVFPVMK